MRTGEHADLGRTIYSWIFDAHHIVMGDMNCEWRSMIGGAVMDYGWTPAKPGVAPSQEPWVKPETHSAAIRPGGTYLPGITQEKTPRYNKKGEKIGTTAVSPPAFDLVVLQDDRMMQPAENIVPVVRVDALDRWGPDVADRLNALAARLTTRELRILNVRVDNEESVERVAGDWLTAKQLMRAD